MFNKTSTKITLGIVVITTIVLIFVSVLALNRAHDEFRAVVSQYDIYTGRYIRLPPADSDNGPGMVPLEKSFNDKFSTAIIIGSIIGVVLSILAGSFYSRILTKPLSLLQEGIVSLKSNGKKKLIARTGEQEFDVVIDEFNDLVKELDYQDELRSNMISDVAHELKTPITSLMVQIQAVKDGILKLDEKRSEILLEEMNRLNDLVDQLNDYTRFKSTLPRLYIEDVNLKDMFERFQAVYQPLLKEKGIKIESNLPDGLVIQGDKKLLTRMVTNIVQNAIFHSEGNLVKISANKEHLSIKDNGKGINTSEIPRIFERFYRVEKSRNKKSGGLGLGLAIVKEIADAHGWKLEVISGNDSEGTEFLIKFKEAVSSKK